MSDALNFLVKARPAAMGHYFKFLKDCGSRLDPKTRDLISVITKVHAQTERGFKQYLTRALRDGCSAAEVIDALLMAFPALGLARIVWAVDLILAMDLPQFQPAALGQEGDWHDLIGVDEVAPGGTLRVERDGRALFVHRAAIDGRDDWRVYDSRCPHQTTDIPHLALQGTTLTCPKHEWAFDIESGHCIAKGDAPLTRWDARVVDARVQARW
jgi:nitrite reductase/ring-hydroxylating ferredoxin subunit/alkylhydroperoxidase/carboxymuconolactone decarboxylase family protein YurZ